MIGVDIAEIARVRKAVAGDGFRSGVFTPGEQAYCDGKPDPCESYAGVFCAKEAVVKALGTGFGRGIGFKDIEIAHSENGAPSVIAHGAAAAYLEGREIGVSISHDGGIAIAVAQIERR